MESLPKQSILKNMTKTEIGHRIESLDLFKGFLIFVMIAANFLAPYDVVPAWFKHAQIFGTIRLVDIGVTLFMFTIGVSLGLSFERYRESRGTKEALWRYMRRDLLFIAFGIAGSLFTRQDVIADWNVLQSIGLGSLIALPFMFLSESRRLMTGLALIMVFQVVGFFGYWDWLERFDSGGLGGVLGGIAWAGVILVGSFFSSSLRDDWKQFQGLSLLIAVLLVGTGLVLSPLLPFDKRLVTASYLFLTTGIAVFGAYLFEALVRIKNVHIFPLKLLGTNAMTVFMLHGIMILLLQSFFPVSSSAEVALFALTVLYAVCFVAARWLYGRRLFIRL